MNPIWELPKQYTIGEKTYSIHGDYRDILEIFSYLENPDLPVSLRWRIALALFYGEEIPVQNRQEAARYLNFFICCGQTEEPKPGPPLIDWQTDAPAILADINKVAGQEIRSLPYLHWWTFMTWFHGIGEGQLSAVLTIRQKLRSGKKLDAWEKEYYRENRKKIDTPRHYSRQELLEQERIQKKLEKSSSAQKVSR